MLRPLQGCVFSSIVVSNDFLLAFGAIVGVKLSLSLPCSQGIAARAAAVGTGGVFGLRVVDGGAEVAAVLLVRRGLVVVSSHAFEN